MVEMQDLRTWREETREFDAPGFDLNDPAVQSLFQMWKVDEETKQKTMNWLTSYLNHVKSRGLF